MAGCWLVPGCLTTAEWGRAKLCWAPGRAAPRPARPALSSVIMRGPGHLSHTVRVTHYVDTFWPARIMFHPWSNAAQKTRSHFLLWRGVAITERGEPTPALSHSFCKIIPFTSQISKLLLSPFKYRAGKIFSRKWKVLTDERRATYLVITRHIQVMVMRLTAS